MSSDDLAATRLAKIGFVFQFHFLLPEFSVLDNVMVPMRKLGEREPEEMRDRAAGLLTDLGLDDQMKKRPDQLSGGQRQRVAIALALANEPDLLGRLALALGIGLLVGFERGWQRRDEAAGARATGIRTFILIGLFGGIAAALGKAVSDLILAASFIAFAILVVTVYATGVMRGGGRGATTEVAALATFALGALAVRGDMAVAAATAVVLTAVLDLKRPLHGLVRKVTEIEMVAGLKLLAISSVLRPVLPNRGFGPGGILNPYAIWWMVVLVAGITFGGYLALRIAGPRSGPVLMGLIGGIASSTAVTVSASRLARAAPGHTRRFAAAIAAATSVMFLRTLVVAAILFPALIVPLGAPLVAASLAGAAVAWLFARRAPTGDPGGGDATKAHLDIQTPDDIGTAIKFGLALALVTLLAYYAKKVMGDGGLYATAGVDADTASLAILIAVAVNTLVKIGIARTFGSAPLMRHAAILAVVCALAAAGGYVLGTQFDIPVPGPTGAPKP